MIAVLEREQKAGRKVAALESRPALFQDLRPVWEMWVAVSRTRPPAFGGISPVSITEMKAWLDLQGYTNTSVRVEYYELISELDTYYLQKMHEKFEAEKKNKTVPVDQ